MEAVVTFEKRFARGPAVAADVRLPADRFAVTVLFGPSGAGKTTVLRCLAGLERPDSGTIRWGNEIWFDSRQGLFVPPQRRHVGALFQDYALFPHLTVAANVAYALRGVHEPERGRRVADVLHIVGLPGFERRYPRQLSSGEQQRVALARAVVRRPRLLLLDEPLSALDAPARERLRTELRRMLKELGVPVVVVTHDRMEALTLGDRLIVMIDGRVRQTGAVPDVFGRPVDLDVARFVGVETVLPGQVVSSVDGLVTVAVGGARLTALAAGVERGDCYVAVRAEDVMLVKGRSETSSARNRLPGRIDSLTREGPMVRIALDCGFPLTALLTKQACEELGLEAGEVITALIKAPAVHLIPRG